MSRSIHVEVNNIAGNLLEMDVEICSTALDIKGAIARAWDVPPRCQQLISGNAVLQDTDVLSTRCTHEAPLLLTMATSVEAAHRTIRLGMQFEKLAALEDVCKLEKRGGVYALQAVINGTLDNDQRVKCRSLDALRFMAFTFRDDPEAMDVMCSLLEDRCYISAGLVALSSAEAHGNPKVIAALSGLIRRTSMPVDHSDKEALLKAVHTLALVAERGDVEAISVLCERLADLDAEVRLCIVSRLSALAAKGDERVKLAMIQSLQDVDDDVRHAAVATLKSAVVQGDVQGASLIRNVIKDSQCTSVDCAAMLALAHISQRGDTEAVALISGRIQDTHADVRFGALRALEVVAARSDQAIIEAISMCVQDSDSDVRHAAVKALSRIAEKNNATAVVALKSRLKDTRELVRRAARDGLGKLLDQEDIPGEADAESTSSGLKALDFLELWQSYVNSWQSYVSSLRL